MSATDGVALHGRETELQQIRAAVDAGSDRTGLAVAVVGPAGIGKTELLRAAAMTAAAQGLRVLTASGGQEETDLPFGVVLDLLTPVVDELDDPFRGAAELCEPLFRRGQGGMPEPAAAARGLFWLVAELSERGRVLLAVDDAHWADPASLRFLVYLSRRVADIGVSLLFAARPAEPGAVRGRLAPVLAEALVIEPRPLDQQASTELVRSRLPDADDRFASACHEATAGNPFLLEQLLVEVERMRSEGHEVEADDIEASGSSTIATWLHDRLRHMGGGGLDLVRSVAVLGPAASLGACTHVSGVPLEAAEELASQMVRARILEDEGDVLAFIHPLVRSSVLEAMTAGERSNFHRRAAEQLEQTGAAPEIIAGHLLRAAPSGRTESVEMLRRAARRATAAGAPDEAVSYLARALREPPTPDLRAPVAHELGAVSEQAGRPDAAEQLAAALDLADSPAQRAAVALDLGRALLLRGRAEEAIDLLDTELASLPPDAPVLSAQVEGQLLMNSQATLAARDRLLPRLHALWKRRAELGAPHELPLLAILASEAALARTAGEADELARRALADGALLRLVTADAPHHQLAATALVLVDCFDEADAAMTAALADARRRGSVAAFSLVSSWRAWGRLRNGRLLDAEADAEASLAALEGNLEALISRPVTMACLIETALERSVPGPNDDLPVAGPALESGLFQPLTVARARRAMHQREPQEALDLLASCQSWAEAWGNETPAYIPWRSLMAEAHLQLGAADRAWQLASDELEAAKRFGSRRAIGCAARVAGLAAGSLDMLEEASEALGASGARLEYARALLALGSAQRRAGARQEARAVLREALDAAVECDATGMEQSIREELRVAGARLRRRRVRGWEALTPAELRVARMAARGMANRDIAQDLFVSIRTVEMHLSNAYRKLGISGRAALGQALDATSESSTGQD